MASAAPAIMDREEVQRRVASVVIIVSEPIKAPVIIIQGDRFNPYQVIERHLAPGMLSGGDRFWRLTRSLHEPTLETWRPRVAGVQLKALQGARLPDGIAEWNAVHAMLEALPLQAFRPRCSPRTLVDDLAGLAEQCAMWWDSRNRPPGGAKRSASRNSSGSGTPNKRQFHHASSTSVGDRGDIPPLSPACEMQLQPLQHFSQQQQHAWHQTAPPFPGGLPLMPLPGGTSVHPAGLKQSPDDSIAAGLGGLALPSLPPFLATEQDLGDLRGGGGGAGPRSHHHAMSPPLHPQHPQQLHSQRSHSLPALLPQSLPAASSGTGFDTSAIRDMYQQPATSGAELLPAAGDGFMMGPIPQQAQQQAQQQQVARIMRELDQRIVALNVGGAHFTTTAATLAMVEGSFLWKLVFLRPRPASPRAGGGEFFIDRDGKVFEHVIGYLRAVHHREVAPPLPRSRDHLAAIVREASFYALPDLAAHAQAQSDELAAETAAHTLSLDIHIDEHGRGTLARFEMDAHPPPSGNGGGF